MLAAGQAARRLACQNAMSFRWQYDDEHGLLRVHLGGSFSDDDLSRTAAAALAASGRWPRARVLVDIRDLLPAAVPTPREVAARVERWIRQMGVPARVAIIADPGARSGIARLLEQLAGEHADRVGAFETEATAITWLVEREGW